MTARRVLAVFPLLPDPGAFLARVRKRFPDAKIELYTASAEAKKRAEGAGESRVFYRELKQLSAFVPPEVRGTRYDAVVVSCDPARSLYYLMFLVQTAFLPGAERYVDAGSGPEPFSCYRGWLMRELIAHFVPAFARTVLLHAAWLALLPVAATVGRVRGRTHAAMGELLRRTASAVATPLPYLPIRPLRLREAIPAAWAVLRDFARGPARGAGDRSLLLVRLDHVGDLIVTTGAVQALADADPPWTVTAIVAPWAESVLRADPRVSELIVYPAEDAIVARGSGKVAADAERVREDVRRRLRARTFDAVVDPLGCIDSTRLVYTARARNRATMHLNRWFLHGATGIAEFVDGERESERLRRVLAAAAVEIRPDVPSIRLDETARDAAGRWLVESGVGDRPFLFIHPGAGAALRKWEPERFGELASRAFEEFGVLSVASFVSGEEKLIERFRGRIGEAVAYTPVDLPLATVFGLIERARGFVGNDSAFMHAAAALNRPTLGIFGPSDAARWTPDGDRVGAVTVNLACSPCLESYCTDPRCMSELGADLAWERLAMLLRMEND